MAAEHHIYKKLIENYIHEMTAPCLESILQCHINTMRLRQNGRHFPDDIFKCIFLNENSCILMKISMKVVP